MPPRLPYPSPAGLRASRQAAVERWSALPKASRRALLAACILPQYQSPGSPARPASLRCYATSGPARSVFALPPDYVPPTQPPSAKGPELRKSQLLRTYTSLLRSTPLMLIFQHNNLTSVEWMAVRRELAGALERVAAPGAAPPGVDIAASIRMNVIRSRMFGIALRIVEFFDGAAVAPAAGSQKTYKHDLSRAALAAISTVDEDKIPDGSVYGQLKPMLVGPLALLTLPAVSPAHLAAVLSVLAPSPPAFPAPTRRKSPGYFDPVFQNGLAKLLLVGGRIDGKVFDLDGVKWVGGIPGGLDGLRAQLVAMLQSAGMGLTSTLEGAGKSLWLTVESRKGMLEEEQKGAEELLPPQPLVDSSA